MFPDEKYWAPHQTETEATNSLQLIVQIKYSTNWRLVTFNPYQKNVAKQSYKQFPRLYYYFCTYTFIFCKCSTILCQINFKCSTILVS